ncbi:hypothetical protein G6M26_41725 [Agrobacterium tumefaciens]|nr:hypothetical protein [Agrobacterium tumefaciens]NTE25068.1 hypothetical protein [Agrobacterium tumefaciens]
MKRVCIYPKDVSQLTGKSVAQSQRVLRNLKLLLNKRKEQFITLQEYADYSGIDLELIRKICLTISFGLIATCN